MQFIFNLIKGFYKAVHKFITGYDIQALHMFRILFWLTLLPILLTNFEGMKSTLIVLIVLSPFWLLPVIVGKLWELWIEYIQLQYIADSKQESALYEIVVPKSVQKSPAAMELFFEGLLLTQGETTEFNRYLDGKVRPWWSLEITGINGEVRMYMWMWKRFKEHVEAQLYGQFPEVELHEVEDYAAKVHYDPEKHFAWGTRYNLANHEALPIKTYVDFGLHEHADKWETKIDPMVNMLEKFALAKQGEQIWLQILFQKSDRKVDEEADEIISQIYKEKSTEFTDPNNPDEKTQGFAMLTPGDREKVESINRTSKKPAFDCVLRGLYIADKDKMNTHRIQSVVKMFLNYNGYNSFGLDGDSKGGDYPWEKWTLPNQDDLLSDFIAAYTLRSGFHSPYQRPSITLTTEELATIYHFPSEEGSVPGMNRVQAKSAGPPPNLPTG